MKKGFTLIELLGVIIVLAAIALISTPIVSSQITKSKKSSFSSSAYAVARAAEDYYYDTLAYEEMDEQVIYDIQSVPFDLSGETADSGKVAINISGKVALALRKEDWCATKKYSDKTITITEKKSCTLDTSE